MRLACVSLAILVSFPTARAKELSAAAQEYIEMFEASAGNPASVRYPQLADRIRGLFPAQGAIKIASWSREAGTRKEGAIIYIEDTRVEIVAPEGEWNLSTDDQYVYEWKTGSTSGLRLKRVNEDLVALLYYDTDPSWLMADLYFDYLSNPQSFRVAQNSADPGILELVLKEPREGFEAVYISLKPLWFHGFRAHGNEARFSKPEALSEIPPAIRERRLQVTFQDSNWALTRHLDFL